MLDSLNQKKLLLNRGFNRIVRDTQLFSLLENWPEAIAAEWSKTRINKLKLRNRVCLESPENIDLAFLFHESWVKKIYTPPGYEIRPNHVVIDIGANIGVFSTYAATRSPDVKVYAYEPFSENLTWLKKNITKSQLPNILVYQEAVTGSSSQRFLQLDVSSGICHSLFSKSVATPTVPTVPVNCVTLNQVMEINQIKECDLLKIDCEGSEYEILQQSSTATLKRIKRIVGEYHESPNIPGSGQELCRFLESHSFRIDRLEDNIFWATNLAAI